MAKLILGTVMCETLRLNILIGCGLCITLRFPWVSPHSGILLPPTVEITGGTRLKVLLNWLNVLCMVRLAILLMEHLVITLFTVLREEALMFSTRALVHLPRLYTNPLRSPAVPFIISTSNFAVTGLSAL